MRGYKIGLFVGAMVLLVVGCSGGDEDNGIGNREVSLKSCDARYGSIEPVIFMDDALHPPKGITSEDVCAMGRDVGNRLRKLVKDIATKQCIAVNKHIANSNMTYNTFISGCQQYFDKLDAKTLTTCNLAKSCGPALADVTANSIKLADSAKPPIFSVGRFRWNGKDCLGYLLERAGIDPGGVGIDGGDYKIYELYGISSCASFYEDVFKKMDVDSGGSPGHDSLYLPEQNPTGIYIGDYLAQIGYTGKIPNTFRWKDMDYPTRRSSR